MRYSIVLLGVLTSCARLTGLDPMGPGTRLERIRVDGAVRSFALHAARRDSLGNHRPLLLVFHGYSGNGPRMEQETGFSQLADSLGFVVAYPNGDRDGRNRRHWDPADLSFVRALIDTLVRRYALDPSRVYVAGYSNGGMLCYRVAAEMSDRVAAIGIVAGTLGHMRTDGTVEDLVLPPRPVPAIIFHGRDDQRIPYDFTLQPVRGRIGNAIPAPRSAAIWAATDRCLATPAIDTLQGNEVVRSDYMGCAAGTEVTLYTIVHGGHDWPNPNRPGAHIAGSALMWRFFRQFSIPEH
jgi:polyhydroxybutyrate depolymerase